MKVLSAFPHKNSFRDSDLIFMVIFQNVCEPAALVSESQSLSALHRETVSGRGEAQLPMGSQPGLETEHIYLRMAGCYPSIWDKPGGGA